MSTLERALALAAEAHAGQLKRGREPFILHVLRVVTAVHEPDQRVVAALHDVLEKSDWTLDGLRREGFSDPVLAAVDALTERPGERREAYLRRVRANPTARAVKLADLRDNVVATYEAAPSDANEARLARYPRERAYLERGGDSI